MGRIDQGREGKKLKGAARFWASGGQSDGEGDAVSDLALFGVDQDTAARWVGAEEKLEEEYAVWQENWEAVGIFMALQTQWRLVAGVGGTAFSGLDYTAALATMRMLGVPKAERPILLADLITLERAALPLLNATKGRHP